MKKDRRAQNDIDRVIGNWSELCMSPENEGEIDKAQKVGHMRC